MQIQISAEEIFAKYKEQLAELNHDLLIAHAKEEKLLEVIRQHEQAETDRVRSAAEKRPMTAQAPAQTLPGIPAAPVPPSASGERSGAEGVQTA